MKIITASKITLIYEYIIHINLINIKRFFINNNNIDCQLLFINIAKY